MAPIPLSPIDHVFTGQGSYPIEFVFAYPGTMNVERLVDSLRRALQAFPPAASKLVRLSDRALGFEPTDDGCSFVEAESTESFALARTRYRFLDSVESVEGRPLTRIKLTHTPDGSVLGVSMSHAVADGFSYFHFLSSWSRLFRGQAVVAPSHQRELLIRPAGEEESEPTPDRLLDRCGLFWSGRRKSVDRDRLQWNRYRLTREQTSAILSEAQQSSPLRLSHNDAIAAWLWRQHVPRRDPGPPPATTYLSCPVDFRRLLPGFPPTYFGCAVALSTASLDRDRLMSAPLGDLALAVRRAVGAIDADRVRQSSLAIDEFRRRRGLSAMDECHVVHPHRGLLVTNLSRLPVHEVVFDAGPPVGFDILTPGERCAVLLSAADGFDVRVCLPLE